MIKFASGVIVGMAVALLAFGIAMLMDYAREKRKMWERMEIVFSFDDASEIGKEEE